MVLSQFVGAPDLGTLSQMWPATTVRPPDGGWQYVMKLKVNVARALDALLDAAAIAEG